MLSPLEFIQNLLKNDAKIFESENEQDAVKDALAILICHIIYADGKVTKQEQKKIFGFFQNECEMDKSETDELFDSILGDMDKFGKHLDILTDALKSNAHAKSEVLRHLNNIIICDGCVDREYEIFEVIRKSL